jgi:hypothetical protein
MYQFYVVHSPKKTLLYTAELWWGLRLDVCVLVRETERDASFPRFSTLPKNI